MPLLLRLRRLIPLLSGLPAPFTAEAAQPVNR
jgi:hypothetical protein